MHKMLHEVDRLRLQGPNGTTQCHDIYRDNIIGGRWGSMKCHCETSGVVLNGLQAYRITFELKNSESNEIREQYSEVALYI